MSTESRRWLWIVLVIAASMLLSLGLTCATPFAALATLTALHMTRRDAVAVTVTTWLASQAIGFGLLTAFAGAFVVYQAVLFSATAALSSDPAHFAPAVVLDVLRVNAISVAVLLILHRLGMGIGLVGRQSVPARASAA
jgi:hypothetical protein